MSLVGSQLQVQGPSKAIAKGAVNLVEAGSDGFRVWGWVCVEGVGELDGRFLEVFVLFFLIGFGLFMFFFVSDSNCESCHFCRFIVSFC